MDAITTLFSLAILIISIMFHELAHGTMAYILGDDTAKLQGRLTLNPLKHLEWVGSFMVPLICVISGTGFVIGWAKPVPFNESLLKNRRYGPALVAIAGPVVNIIFAIIGSLIVHTGVFSFAFVQMIAMVVVINISLAVFNLIPVPPLDGHHILGAIVPSYKQWSIQLMRSYGFVILIAVLLLASTFISPVISFFIRIALP